MDQVAQVDMFGPTIEEAKARFMVEAQSVEGTHCPCCKKFAKVYHRKFNSRMALTMIYTYPWFRSHPFEWLDVGNFLVTKYNMIPGDHGKLIWWGMLEKKPEKKDGAKTSGLYRMTNKGYSFVNGLRVQSHVNEYMSEVQSFDGQWIDIRVALGSKFDYGELMRAAGVWA